MFDPALAPSLQPLQGDSMENHNGSSGRPLQDHHGQLGHQTPLLTCPEAVAGRICSSKGVLVGMNGYMFSFLGMALKSLKL